MLHGLPGRISAVVVTTVLLFVGTTAFSVVWMTHALDQQSLVQTEKQVEITRSNLLDRVSLVAIDYAKWDAAFEAVRVGDLDWVFDNIGSAAIIGEAVQLVIVRSDAFGEEVGWYDDGVIEPRADLLTTSRTTSIMDSLSDASAGAFEVSSFFEWRDDELFAMAASHFEPVEHAAEVPLNERFSGQLILGTRVDTSLVTEIEDSLLISGLSITRTTPTNRSFIELTGLDGRPVAYLSWDIPRPGTTLLWKILPLLIGVTTAASALAFIYMRLVRRSAEILVVAEQQASLAARSDSLTGLSNRAAFQEIISSLSARGERAILFIDVDDFKRINDSIGHAAGDKVILYLAQRLQAIASPNSHLARIGGDEFVFVVNGPDAGERVSSLVELVHDALARQFDVQGHQMRLKVSMGFAVQSDDDTTGSDLVRQADLAMYEAKRSKMDGKAVAFDGLLEHASRDAAVIERALRRALDKPDQFSIMYQPVVDMNGRMKYAEALARWTSPELGRVAPDRFITVAEQAGLVVSLGRKLIQLICDDMVVYPDLRVSLNISPLQLMTPDLIPELVRDLASRNIDISRVEIELTESVIVDDPSLASERLGQLKVAGFAIALDDFGTGYSSMGYLLDMKFDTLKIDRSFVSRVQQSPGGVSIVDGMIRIAHGMGLKVVCEGVESVEEFDVLRRLGCDLIQGYHFDRPLLLNVLAERWLASGRKHIAVA